MAVTPKDLWATVKELLIEQYRGNLREEIESGTYVDDEGVERHYELPEGADNRLQGVLKAVIEELLHPVDDAAVDIGQLADVSQAEGEWLDVLGKLAGQQRYYQESDRDFRVRVEAALDSDNAGTPDNVIYNAAILSGDSHPQYMDEAPATFIVYDGPVYERHHPDTDGKEPYDELVKPAAQRQLLRREVKKLAPCGVLGLPGAAIMMSDGRLLCTSDHKKLILAVANDANSEVDIVLIDNGGHFILTSQQKVVKVSIKGDVRYQTTPVHMDGVPGTVDCIRIKDLPDGGDVNSYMVRDSDTEGTVKSRAMDESELDELWDSTPAEGEV